MFTVTVIGTQAYLSTLHEETSRGRFFGRARAMGGGVIEIEFYYEKPGTTVRGWEA